MLATYLSSGVCLMAGRTGLSKWMLGSLVLAAVFSGSGALPSSLLGPASASFLRVGANCSH